MTAEGDQNLDASDLRSTLGVIGAGIRAGVISDGMQGLAQARPSGDLPSTINATTRNMVTAPSSPPGAQPSPTDAGARAEGTAMMEIVHDLAPNAESWFGYSPPSRLPHAPERDG